jgi:hypothetical protein
MSLIDFRRNLSGFDYEALEVMRGRDIAWYNTQFYCGWGDCSNPLMYDLMVQKGWPPEKIVIGLLTNSENGHGYVPFNPLSMVLTTLRGRYGKFGGVMGWEYFNSLPGGKERPWEWAREMTKLLRGHILSEPAQMTQQTQQEQPATVRSATKKSEDVDPDTPGGKDVPVPKQFDYYTDGSDA